MKKLRLLLLDVIGGTGLQEVEVNPSNLSEFYTRLKCDVFDITRRKIGGKAFDIFCDDIGLFADNPIPSALNIKMKPELVGNLIFANHDSEGNTTGLSDDDIERIKAATVAVVDVESMKSWKIVMIGDIAFK